MAANFDKDSKSQYEAAKAALARPQGVDPLAACGIGAGFQAQLTA